MGVMGVMGVMGKMGGRELLIAFSPDIESLAFQSCWGCPAQVTQGIQHGRLMGYCVDGF